MGASVTPSEDTPKCSEMKRMEAGDEGGSGLRTLECLRARLLAERQTSRVARDEAQLMENKLMELENKLKEETKLRKRAEKKLKLLMRKLEALKICATFEGLELSSSSENGSSWASCTSSSTSVSCPKDHEECDSKSQKTISCRLHRPKDHCSLGESSHGLNSIAQGSNACEYDTSFFPTLKRQIRRHIKRVQLMGGIARIARRIHWPWSPRLHYQKHHPPLRPVMIPEKFLDTLRLVRETRWHLA